MLLRLNGMLGVNPLTWPIQILGQGLSFWAGDYTPQAPGRRRRRRPATDFDVDPETGFLPPRPLPRLSAPFDIWESVLTDAREALTLGECDDDDDARESDVAGERWRNTIRTRVLIAIKWPVLSVDSLLGDVRRLQRAHLVLAWLVQFFVHSVSKGSDESGTLVPRTLAIPLVRVSNALGIAPVLTYADTVLWNWERIRPEEPTSIDNIRYTNLFSGTDDESNFFMALARVELRGTEIPGIIDDCIYAASEGEVNCIWKTADRLARLADIIADLSEAIESVRSTCDPHVFFWAIRPWFEGSGGSYGGLGQRWIYEGVEDSDDLDLSGPSGGQSSAIHALDLFLDVDHKSRRDSCAAAATGREAEKNAECGFMERMRRYMPGSHREYLSQVSSVRALAQREPMLQEGYDSAVMALKKLRDVHMRIACLYIVRMAKTKPSGRGGCPVSHTMEKMQKARGTGGSELCTLLEAGRAATKRTLLGPKWGQRYEDVH